MSEELKPSEQEQPAAESAAVEQTPDAVENTAEAPAVAEAPAAAEEAPAAAEEAPAAAEEAPAAAEAPAVAEEAPAEEQAAGVDVEAIIAELKDVKKSRGTIEVLGSRRIRGGILVEYKGFTMFLPTPHLSLKENPSENDLLSLLQKTFPVSVHEISDGERKKVIVSRRPMLRKEALTSFEIGSVHEGKVVAITDFGAFVDIGGVEGMVHVSRISHKRIKTPSEILSKGDIVKVKIKEITPKSGRLSLSMKEFESSPWDDIATKANIGDKVQAVVRNLSDFGAYVFIPSLSVEGMIHISELSWMRRVSKPSEVLSEGQEIEAVIIKINAKDKKIGLSYKQVLPNPWDTMKERFEIGAQVNGIVRSFRESGAVIGIADDVDGFMPRGKMTPDARAKKVPFEIGEEIPVLIMDVVPESQSVILGMEGFDQRGGGGNFEGGGNRRSGGGNFEGGGNRRGGGGKPRGERRGRGDGEERGASIPQSAQAGKGGVTLSDLLSEDEKKRLFGDS